MDHRSLTNEEDLITKVTLNLKVDTRSCSKLKLFFVVLFVLFLTIYSVKRFNFEKPKPDSYRDDKEGHAIEWLMRERRQVLRQICSTLKVVGKDKTVL